MAIKGLYTVQNPGGASAHFKAMGVEVDVVCASAECGLDFGVNGVTLAQRRAQRLAYRALCRELGCIRDIDSLPRVMAPRLVADPSSLEDDELVQPAVGLGVLEGHNVNPVCLGMTTLGMDIATVVCNSFADSPSTWWAYVATRGGMPFTVVGVLQCDWRQAHRGVVQRMMDLIKRHVVEKGLRFNPDNLWVWVSPGGCNGEDGARPGLSIGDDDVLRLVDADLEYEDYVTFDAGISDELPHGLDTVNLAVHQLFAAGLPHENLGGLYQDTVTTRTNDDTGFRWGSTQRDGIYVASSVLAGTVRRLW